MITRQKGDKPSRLIIDDDVARAAMEAVELSTDDPFQRLRESFGSILVQRGVSIIKVSRWLGHSSVRVTEKHYVGLLAYDSDIDA